MIKKNFVPVEISRKAQLHAETRNEKLDTNRFRHLLAVSYLARSILLLVVVKFFKCVIYGSFFVTLTIKKLLLFHSKYFSLTQQFA